jgi:CheY-like chemotaxis protein
MKLNPKDSIYDDILDIKIAGEHSANLIRHLLTFARRQPNVPKVIDIQAAISRCLTLLRPMIGENIQLHWVPTASAWPIKIDPVQIEQILTNLMVNARDAISDKGSITIHSENMEIDEEFCKTNAGFVCGKYIHLTVRDDGCGMDKATQKQIFEPFFTTKELGKGTGLGLATVYGIVLQNHGFITLSSELGKGTTFHIYLPRYEAPIMDIQKQDIVPSIDTEVILVAEDNDTLLKVVANMLKKLGYTVLPANNPNEAIQICRECPGDIHMLLTDVIMPGMDGKELYQHVIAMRPTLKGLFMSGYTADVIAQWGVLDEGIHFLQKPFSMEELSRKVREALSAQQ